MDISKISKLRQCNQSKDIASEVWKWIAEEAAAGIRKEPALAEMLNDICIVRTNLIESVSARLSRKLSRRDMPREKLEPLLLDVLGSSPSISEQIAYDLLAIVDRDPACHSPLEPLLFYKGFHAISTYRFAHKLWQDKRTLLALQAQSVMSEVFSVDIHPAATIGCGILLDHATGFVVGETAIIKNNVSILHEVTLGGTGKDDGNRHPVVESGVLIGAGAKILGRVTIGHCSKVAASSVVLSDVPPYATVAGVPATVVNIDSKANPALQMDQDIRCGS